MQHILPMSTEAPGDETAAEPAVHRSRYRRALLDALVQGPLCQTPVRHGTYESF